MMSRSHSPSRRDRSGRIIGAAILASVALCGIATASDHPDNAGPADTVVAGIAHRAVSAGWDVEDVTTLLGTPTRVVERSGGRWLVYTRHDRQVTFAVSGTRVTAAQLTRRTRSVGAFSDLKLALTRFLGPPSASGRHEARWDRGEVTLRVGGWRGEYDVEVRRAGGTPGPAAALDVAAARQARDGPRRR